MSWGHGIDIPMPFETRLIAHEYALGAAMPVVRSSDEAWEAFARADEEFRNALTEQVLALKGLLQQNPFGECVEGRTMHERVSSVIRAGNTSVLGSVENQCSYLSAHAEQCRTGASRIGGSDELRGEQ